jgi:hypothetical protein
MYNIGNFIMLKLPPTEEQAPDKLRALIDRVVSACQPEYKNILAQFDKTARQYEGSVMTPRLSFIFTTFAALALIQQRRSLSETLYEALKDFLALEAEENEARDEARSIEEAETCATCATCLKKGTCLSAVKNPAKKADKSFEDELVDLMEKTAQVPPIQRGVYTTSFPAPGTTIWDTPIEAKSPWPEPPDIDKGRKYA